MAGKKIAAAFAASSVVVMTYQNCSPQKFGSSSSSPATTQGTPVPVCPGPIVPCQTPAGSGTETCTDTPNGPVYGTCIVVCSPGFYLDSVSGTCLAESLSIAVDAFRAETDPNWTTITATDKIQLKKGFHYRVSVNMSPNLQMDPADSTLSLFNLTNPILVNNCQAMSDSTWNHMQPWGLAGPCADPSNCTSVGSGQTDWDYSAAIASEMGGCGWQGQISVTRQNDPSGTVAHSASLTMEALLCNQGDPTPNCPVIANGSSSGTCNTLGTAYNACVSQCDSGYTASGTQPNIICTKNTPPPVPGACGSVSGGAPVTSLTNTSANICGANNLSPASPFVLDPDNNKYEWSCTGKGPGGTTVNNCSVQKKACDNGAINPTGKCDQFAGACGSVSGGAPVTSLTSASANICGANDISPAPGFKLDPNNNKYEWSCTGKGGGTTVNNCSVQKKTCDNGAINPTGKCDQFAGACGSVSGGAPVTSLTSASANICGANDISPAPGFKLDPNNNKYEWSCTGKGGGTTVNNCSVQKKTCDNGAINPTGKCDQFAGACGSVSGGAPVTSLTNASSNICGANNVSPASPFALDPNNNKYEWSCTGKGGGTTVNSCSVQKKTCDNGAINPTGKCDQFAGACGTVSGGAPVTSLTNTSTNICGANNISPASPFALDPNNNKYEWSCTGKGPGGTTVNNCSVQKKTCDNGAINPTGKCDQFAGACGSVSGGAPVTSLTNTSANICGANNVSPASPFSLDTTADKYKWSCTGQGPGGTTVSNCSVNAIVGSLSTIIVKATNQGHRGMPNDPSNIPSVAYCPSGYSVTGGGYGTTGDYGCGEQYRYELSNYPIATIAGQNANAWTAMVNCTSYYAYAVCTKTVISPTSTLQTRVSAGPSVGLNATSTAPCNSDEVLTGGGFDWAGPAATDAVYSFVDRSEPSGNNWQVHLQQAPAKSYAICAKISGLGKLSKTVTTGPSVNKVNPSIQPSTTPACPSGYVISGGGQHWDSGNNLNPEYEFASGNYPQQNATAWSVSMEASVSHAVGICLKLNP